MKMTGTLPLLRRSFSDSTMIMRQGWERRWRFTRSCLDGAGGAGQVREQPTTLTGREQHLRDQTST